MIPSFDSYFAEITSSESFNRDFFGLEDSAKTTAEVTKPIFNGGHDGVAVSDEYPSSFSPSLGNGAQLAVEATDSIFIATRSPKERKILYADLIPATKGRALSNNDGASAKRSCDA